MSSNMLHLFIKPFLCPAIKFSFKGQKHVNQEGIKTEGIDIQDKWEDLLDF